MPRPKGSKNKVTKNKAPRKITVANNDFEAQSTWGQTPSVKTNQSSAEV